MLRRSPDRRRLDAPPQRNRGRIGICCQTPLEVSRLSPEKRHDVLQLVIRNTDFTMKVCLKTILGFWSLGCYGLLINNLGC